MNNSLILELTLYRYGRFVRENEVSLDMADCCSIEHMNSSTAACNYTVTPRSSCMNYKLVLRNKNDRTTAFVTNGNFPFLPLETKFSHEPYPYQAKER